jgi:type II secretory pathway pseudopilin PulG
VRIPKARIKDRYGDCDRKKSSAAAFTLLELLVAMGILVIIILIVARIFAQASAAWSTGARLSEVNMTGRAVVDFVAQDLSQAVVSTNLGYEFHAAGPTFWIIGDATNGARAATQVTYSYGATLTRLGQQLCDTNLTAFTITAGPGGDNSTQTLPEYVDVLAEVSGASTGIKKFSSRVTFPNRNRYKY